MSCIALQLPTRLKLKYIAVHITSYSSLSFHDFSLRKQVYNQMKHI